MEYRNLIFTLVQKLVKVLFQVDFFYLRIYFDPYTGNEYLLVSNNFYKKLLVKDEVQVLKNPS